MLRVGMIGWRGMVGSVLMQRMREENAFSELETIFFSTSNAGGPAPLETAAEAVLSDARDLKKLAICDVLISCQGGDYTSQVYGPLQTSGWKGYWIDAASTLRMQPDAVIVLDPVNGALIREGLARGVRAFVGGNCTVSLMVMAVGALFQAGLVEWMTTMTYQAASGAGAANMTELVRQMECLVEPTRASPSETALELDRMMIEAQRSCSIPKQEFTVPLAGSLLPWIDRSMPGGQTREEWKGMAETNKLLGLNPQVPVDGICVRIGTMRCHSQGLCIKLTKDVPLKDIEQILAGAHAWAQVIPNNKESTLRCLTPTAVSGTLTVPVGRLHKLKLGTRISGSFHGWRPVAMGSRRAIAAHVVDPAQSPGFITIQSFRS